MTRGASRRARARAATGGEAAQRRVVGGVIGALPSLSQLKDGSYRPGQATSNQARRLEMDKAKAHDEEREREDMLMKLYRLKVSFPEGHIPEYSESTDTATLRKIVEQTRRKLHVNKDTEQYKQWSVMLHMALEFVLCNLLKMKAAKGLAENHMRSAEKYNELLMELGDQQYNSGPSKWPVHWRLIGMLSFETAMFIGTNLLMTKLAGGMMNSFAGMGGGQTQQAAGAMPGFGQPPTMAPPPAMATPPATFFTAAVKMKGPDLTAFEAQQKRKSE